MSLFVKKREYDFWLLFTIIVLLTMGTIMVFSASSYHALYYMGNKYHFLIRQLIWGTVGLVAMFLVSNIDYRRIAQFSPLLMIGSIVLLVVVLIPGVGNTVNGATRWFNFGFASFQPSELMKIAIILFFSYSLSKNGDRVGKFWTGLVPYLLIVGVTDVLLFLEPHMSAIILISMVAVIILFFAGAKVWHFVAMVVPLIIPAWILITSDEYRVQRITAFMDPFKYKQGEGYQVVNSLYAIASGSLFGRGLGKSMQKYLYVPEPHNDFIFSILAEELGFIGAITVVILFLLFIWRGIRIAMNAQDKLGSLIAAGLTSLIAIEAILNIAVVTSTVPATGIPLPFFSYGGTSLVFLLISMGILLNISKKTNRYYEVIPANPVDNGDDVRIKRVMSTRKAGDSLK